MVNSAARKLGWNFSAAALALLLFAVSVAVPFHQVAHASALFAHGHDECGGERSRIESPQDHGDHHPREEACALCQGLTRIVAILPAIPSDARDLAMPTGALGNPGTLHTVPAGHDFQRGPPQEDSPVIRA